MKARRQHPSQIPGKNETSRKKSTSRACMVYSNHKVEIVHVLQKHQ